MIPKIIHYVWVGGKPLNALAKKCIESWKKHCPDYEIKQWDETNFDINENQYCKEAYDSKKWAFVSDYIRLKVLHMYGGIYMDTDVEVVKSLDEFLVHPAFSGFEGPDAIPTGIIGAEKNNWWIANMLSYYDDAHFIKPNGELDQTTNVVLITNGTKAIYPNLQLNNTYQGFKDVVFYPKDYFCPIDLEIRELEKTSNTHTIHWFAGSWIEKPGFMARIRKFFKKILRFFMGKENYRKWIRKRSTKKNG